MMYLSYDTHL